MTNGPNKQLLLQNHNNINHTHNSINNSCSIAPPSGLMSVSLSSSPLPAFVGSLKSGVPLACSPLHRTHTDSHSQMQMHVSTHDYSTHHQVLVSPPPSNHSLLYAEEERIRSLNASPCVHQQHMHTENKYSNNNQAYHVNSNNTLAYHTSPKISSSFYPIASHVPVSLVSAVSPVVSLQHAPSPTPLLNHTHTQHKQVNHEQLQASNAQSLCSGVGTSSSGGNTIHPNRLLSPTYLEAVNVNLINHACLSSCCNSASSSYNPSPSSGSPMEGDSQLYSSSSLLNAYPSACSSQAATNNNSACASTANTRPPSTSPRTANNKRKQASQGHDDEEQGKRTPSYNKKMDEHIYSQEFSTFPSTDSFVAPNSTRSDGSGSSESSIGLCAAVSNLSTSTCQPHTQTAEQQQQSPHQAQTHTVENKQTDKPASHNEMTNANATQAAASNPQSLAPNTPKRQALVSVLSCVLEQLFSSPDDTLPSDPRLLTRFHTERIPSISIGKYLERIAHYSECSDEALIMAFIHISRISHNKPSFHLNALSIHRLLLVSIMCTVKFFDDFYYNNNFYAKIGGVSNKEMNLLEVDFLQLIEFNLWIELKIYKRFFKELNNSILHPQCSCQWKQMREIEAHEEALEVVSGSVDQHMQA